MSAFHNGHLPPQTQCPVCEATDLARLLEIRQVPIHCNVLWPTRAEALQAPRGDMQLVFCRTCGHLFNAAFDPARMEYTPAYENSLHFSPFFQRYAEALAARLIERYALYGKTLIEIGCGKGEFLTLLCQRGGNRGLGFDPGYVPDPNGVTAPVAFIRDFYSEGYASYQADFICCRQVLEHIQFPRDFLQSVRRAIGEQLQTVVFFEVPNARFTLRDLGIWDLIYEHRSYFTVPSLTRLFASCGFEVGSITEAYDGQFLCLEALPQGNGASVGQPDKALDGLASEAAMFAERYRRKVKAWTRRLARPARAGQRVVVWGGGSKGVTFLNTLKIREQVEYVVDVNPRKQGMYVAGTGQQIVPPEFLSHYPPEVVLVMNALYQNEIQQMLEHLGLTPKLVCV